MFLQAVKERNPGLIDYAAQLHQTGAILPDTYVIDVDQVAENARQLQRAADENDVELYFMLKQIGRNPYLAKKVMEAGLEKAVVVDFREAQVMMENNIPIGNIGHLVQVPEAFLEQVMTYGVDYITVYTLEKLRSINEAAHNLNIQQNVFLRVVDEEDNQYPGQYGGFKLDELENIITELKGLAHVKVKGITSFPCFLYSSEAGKIIPTPNLETMKTAARFFETNRIEITEFNTPSCTSVANMPEIKRLGGTQGEPGHALTGTTPQHALTDLAEKPALLYVSEVSHNYDGHAYVYGGGYYRRGHLDKALFMEGDHREESKVLPFADSNIDYYLEVEEEHPVGSTVIMAFRTQIFVTRSEVALVEGLSNGNPRLVGIYDSQGRLLRR
ncbi:YhfX family PLP-dependent enzyme [Atopococcus tabaci]|uniref:YhfX family PLP-dependent enzyme n=1 Tax=Atopococcus tabaci TaxID=269774 RepID=UPI00240A50D7|nr:YhfX family PLP-dependent enzyme [Atopococcus tabaci]